MVAKKAREGNIIVRAFKAAVQFLSEVKAELTKVAWPTRSEVVASTWVVMFAVGITAVWIFASDQISGLVITGLIRLIN